MKKLLLTLVAASSAIIADAAYDKTEASLDNSAIYPGTTHSYVVAVPADIAAGDTCALYIGLDGELCNASAHIDSLTRSGVMPPTVCVFLQPGVVRDAGGEVVRYNRSNEFDAIDGRFASFLETELLPAVRTIVGKRATITDDPQQRMIMGLSSSGIAAFVAAWNRPDLFGKVYSGCGTFVPMRGGNELQALVRKSEPRDIRLFIQDGYDDCWNPIFGSWYEANAMLGTALDFAGYDCAFDWGEGVHSVRRSNEIFTDMMTTLWSRPLAAKPSGNGLLKEILTDDRVWKTEQSAPLAVTDAVVEAVYPDGSLVAVADAGGNWLNQYIIDRTTGERRYGQRFYYLHSYTPTQLTVSGMAFDSKGNLWTVTDAGLQICDQNGRVRAILMLPPEVTSLQRSVIEIGDGVVSITDPATGRRFTRRFNVSAPRAGVRPPSQGAA